jgi:hypothetical protein
MGKQYNKTIKRRRRLAYLDRKKNKAAELAATKSKPRRAKKAEMAAAE